MQWAGVVLVNSRGEILLNLRDDDPAIHWPIVWDVIGGVVEDDETPHECIMRETLEEAGLRLDEFRRFKVHEVPLADGDTARLHMYSARLDKPASELVVGEGQEHPFFAFEEAQQVPLVRGIELVLREFFVSVDYQVLWK
jgi:8-oxo-dGTP diphosphatase